MTTDKYDEMHRRWEADLADLVDNRFVFAKESLEIAVADLAEARKDLERAEEMRKRNER